MRLTLLNAVFWALGNGLVSTTLVTYLALELGARGVAIAWIAAAPRFAGVLRLAAPSILRAAADRGVGRKAVCLAAFAASVAVLPLAPAAVWDAPAVSDGRALTGRIVLLVSAWCLYHLLEYVAVVALWSWIGDLYPPRLRSQLLGRRESCLSVGRLVGVGVSILLAAAWAGLLPGAPRWAPLAASASVGAALMALSLVPLALTTAMASRPSAAPQSPWRSLRRALAESGYRRLIVFNCWLSAANGLTGAAQGMYPFRVLGMQYEQLQSLRAAMWGGQAALAPVAGNWIARFGPRRVITTAQLLVACGPLCFLLAAPGSSWWIAVAFALWVAYAPINIGLDTLKLGLGDPKNNAPYLAVYHALGDLSNGLTMLAGGLLYDLLAAGDQRALRVYASLFLAGWLLRLLAVPLAARLAEPSRRG